jgi:N,N'-diacetylchitobiose transport system substrate-binding protein
MKARILVAVAVAAAVGVTASSAGGSTDRSQASITVWLQTDAQNGWPELVASVNQQFGREHPGVDVNVQYQTWTTHLQKFDATLAGGNAPDVIEMGNTEVTKYAAAGALQDITAERSSFANSANWLRSLREAASYGGRLYGVPYYAGSRIVTYRTDLFKKVGFSKPPTSLAAFTTAAKKLAATNKAKGFSPVYIAGQDWYVALSFVYDYGGQIAKVYRGKWQGTLDSPKSIAGLTAFKKFFLTASRASKSTIETKPWPYEVYAPGMAASMIGNSWFTCCVGDKYKGVTGTFVMPSHEKGKPMPGFLGGSILSVPIGANKALAADWIKAFTDTASQRALQAKGNIPNATNLLGNSVNERAAVRSWFIPNAKNWVNVENGNVIRNMLTQILTSKLTVKQAASSASDNITSVLNG